MNQIKYELLQMEEINDHFTLLTHIHAYMLHLALCALELFLNDVGRGHIPLPLNTIAAVAKAIEESGDIDVVSEDPVPVSTTSAAAARRQTIKASARVLESWVKVQIRAHKSVLSRLHPASWKTVLVQPEFPGQNRYLLQGFLATEGTLAAHLLAPLKTELTARGVAVCIPYHCFMQLSAVLCDSAPLAFARVKKWLVRVMGTMESKLARDLADANITNPLTFELVARTSLGSKVTPFQAPPDICASLLLQEYLQERDLEVAQTRVFRALRRSCCGYLPEPDDPAPCDYLGLMSAIKTVLGVTAHAAKTIMDECPKLLVADMHKGWDAHRTLDRLLDAVTKHAFPASVQRVIPMTPKTSRKVLDIVASRQQILASYRLAFRPDITLGHLYAHLGSTKSKTQVRVEALRVLGGAVQLLHGEITGVPAGDPLPPVCWCWAHRRNLLNPTPPLAHTPIAVAEWLLECVEGAAHAPSPPRVVEGETITPPWFLERRASLHAHPVRMRAAAAHAVKKLNRIVSLGEFLTTVPVHIVNPAAAILCGGKAFVPGPGVEVDPVWRQMVAECSVPVGNAPQAITVLAMYALGRRQFIDLVAQRRNSVVSGDGDGDGDGDEGTHPTLTPTCICCGEASPACVVPSCNNPAHALCESCLRLKVTTYSRDVLGLSQFVAIRPLPADPLACPEPTCEGVIENCKDVEHLCVHAVPVPVATALRQQASGGLHCATCGFPLQGKSSGAGTTKCNICKCNTCHTCSGWAHPGLLCPAVQDIKPLDILTRAKTQPCPNAACGVPTAKMQGCNHMVCNRCGQHWCWACGQAITTMESHYKDLGPGNRCSLHAYTIKAEVQRMEAFIQSLMDSEPASRLPGTQALALLRTTYLQEASDL